MSSHLKLDGKAGPHAPFAELDVVTLRRPLETENGVVPPGSAGTIVHVWRGGEVYEVEFTQPLPALALLRADELTFKRAHPAA